MTDSFGRWVSCIWSSIVYASSSAAERGRRSNPFGRSPWFESMLACSGGVGSSGPSLLNHFARVAQLVERLGVTTQKERWFESSRAL
jgi:hypothetical protein